MSAPEIPVNVPLESEYPEMYVDPLGLFDTYTKSPVLVVVVVVGQLAFWQTKKLPQPESSDNEASTASPNTRW
jgi:hypothetical protein